MFKYIKRKYTSLTSDTRFSEILTGSAWALGARVIATVFGLITSIIIARFYGADILGIVAVLNSFLQLATIFTVLGTNTSILRLIPEHLVKYSPTSAFKVYRKAQYIVVAISLVTSALFFFGADMIASKVFSKPHLSYYFALASVFVVFKSLMLLNTEAVRGIRLIRMFSFMLLLPQGLNLIFLISLGLLFSVRDVPIYAQLGGYGLTGILGFFFMQFAFKKRMKPDDTVHQMGIGKILTLSFPMLMTTAMAFIIGQTGVIILGMFRSEAEIGYYSVAVKLATLTSFILNAVNSMAAPKFSEFFHSHKFDELFYIAKKSAKLIFWTTTPILLFFVIFGKGILIFSFGYKFSMSYPPLVILVLGQFAHSISGSTGLFMNMTGKQDTFKNIMIISALLNIILNLLLIPKYGIIGSAVAAMISLCSWNIITLIYIKIKFGKTTGYFPMFKIP